MFFVVVTDGDAVVSRGVVGCCTAAGIGFVDDDDGVAGVDRAGEECWIGDGGILADAGADAAGRFAPGE